MCDNNINEEFDDELFTAGLNSEEGSKYIEQNIIGLDTSNIDLQFDKKEFKKGVDKLSEICGSVTALVNVGITPDMALQYLSDRELTMKNLDNTYELSKLNTETALKQTQINADATVAQAKYDGISTQKNSI